MTVALGASLEARALCARAGAFALDDVSFTLPAGGYGIVVGPAGAGKSTLLETLAGLQRATRGAVYIGGRDATALPAEQRGIGLVYQHALLFPHLTVAQNVAYGAPDLEAARAAAALLGVESLGGRAVGRLSGGERQLVALARALARRPSVLLLDEPYAALDPASRERVRQAVRALHRTSGITMLQVTHDFAEAGLLGDLALVVVGGRLAQQGAPADLFRRPATPDVARFLGVENVIAGQARSDAGGTQFRGGGLVLRSHARIADGAVHAVVRAEDVVLTTAGETSTSEAIPTRVVDVGWYGPVARLTLDVGAGTLVAAVTAREARALGAAAGVALRAAIEPAAVHLC